jgi:SNF2 family DNA or RNA helicase
MPNNPAELWIHLKVFGLTKLTYYQFVREYCEMVYGWREGDPLQIAGAKKPALPKLQKLLEPFMLRRLAKDVLGQQPPMLSDVIVEAGKWDLTEEEQATVLKETDHFQHILPSFENGLVNDATVALLEGLANSVATLRRYNGCQKIEPVADLVSIELENGNYDKVVLFCIHRDVVAGLKTRLAKWKPVTITGATLPAARQKIIDEFTNNPRRKIFIGNIRAAGTAINLSVARHIYMVEQEWVPGDNQQAIARCSGITQKEPVFVRCVSIAGSIDEKVSAILRRKTQDIIALMDTKLVDSTAINDNFSSL